MQVNIQLGYVGQHPMSLAIGFRMIQEWTKRHSNFSLLASRQRFLSVAQHQTKFNICAKDVAAKDGNRTKFFLEELIWITSKSFVL